MGHKVSLIKQKRMLLVCKQRGTKKNWKILFFVSYQWMISSLSSRFLGSRASAHTADGPKGKHHKQWRPHLPPLSLRFCTWTDVLWCGKPLWSVWVGCPSCVPSQDPPQLLACVGWNARERGWCCASLCEQLWLLSSSQGTAVPSTPFQLLLQSTALWGS